MEGQCAKLHNTSLLLVLDVYCIKDSCGLVNVGAITAVCLELENTFLPLFDFKKRTQIS